MSMTIAPPGGPTWKHCLGPQVLLQDLICLLGVAFVEASGVRRVESQYWVVLGWKAVAERVLDQQSLGTRLVRCRGLVEVAVL
jgi:hypothetical protein